MAIRIFSFFLLLLLTIPLSHAQKHDFFLETGLVVGASDYPKGINRTGEFEPTFSVKVGALTAMNQDFDLQWGIRYSWLSSNEVASSQQVALIDSPIELVHRMIQHYISVPILVHYKFKSTYIFIGPEIGVVAHASYTFGQRIRDELAIVSEETQTIGARHLFSKINSMITIGLGRSWRMNALEGFLQVSYGHSLKKNQASDGIYRAGFGREVFIGTGIRI